MKILASLILSASIASAAQIPVGNVATEQSFAIRSGSQFTSANTQTYEGKILIVMLMTPWCPYCQSNASAVGAGLLDHFNANSRGTLKGKNANGIPIESVLLSTEQAAQWDSVNASFASTNGYGQWGLDATASRGNPRRVLGYFRGGFINSANLYDWGEDRRRVVVLNMVKDSATHKYREIIINQNSFTSSDDAPARAAIDAIQPAPVVNPATITTQPASTTINSGQWTTLTVGASGDAPLTYSWFRGSSGTTTEPVGTNSNSFTTPPLTATTNYWVRVTNAGNPTGDSSATATVTVQQPAAITRSPISTTVNYGEVAMLSVEASGDGLLTYQWFEGESGVTSQPVGTNTPTFTTPSITNTRSYWVRVSNSANPPGADSAAATVSAMLITPSYAHVMSQSPGLFAVSTRGAPGSTYFGWDSFNEPLERETSIHDSTPDLGMSLTGANFQTTNGEDHVIEDGNFSFITGSLAEQITVPTAGTVGVEGFTTLILQIAAIPGTGAFPANITVNSLNGFAPTVVLGVNAAGDGQLWAKWDLQGNQDSYTITLAGSPNQAGFGFDQVTVDTHFRATAYVSDSAAALPPTLDDAGNLPARLVGVPLDQQLQATGGTAPYQFVVIDGNLPMGLSLSSAGRLLGTPAVAATSLFTIKLIDANVLITTKAFSLAVTTAPVISTASPLIAGHVGDGYNVALAASGGAAPYAWTIVGGALPAGLSLSETGVLSGTPTSAGMSFFTLQIQDGNGFTDTKAFSVRISDLRILTTTLLTSVRNVAFTQTLVGNGGAAPYTWAVSAGSLPAGLSLNSGGVISGTPSSSANGTTFTVSLTDSTGIEITRSLTLPVSAVFLAPVLTPISFPTLTIGAEFNHTVTALNYPSAFAITGLPKGLRYSTTTGLITGRPQVSGLYNVHVRAMNRGGSSVAITTPLVVRALDKNLVGSFAGLVDRDTVVNRGLGGTLTVTTTSLGGFTLRLVGALANSPASGAATVHSITGFLAATAPQISVPLGGRTLALTFNATTGQITGTLGAATVNGWRSAWNAANHPAEFLVGYYSMALDLAAASDRGLIAIPQGTGFATLNVSLSGAVTLVGRTSDGEAITSASFLSSHGDFCVYTPMYRNGGSIQGPLHISEDDQGHFSGNEIEGAITWSKPTTTGRTYPTTFGPLNLSVEGAYLAPASKGGIVLGLPTPGSVRLNFTDGGLANSATDPDLTFVLTDHFKSDLSGAVNPAKVVVTLNPATGAISGTFDLRETSPPLLRSKIVFQGQVVRFGSITRKAVGYFLLPQIPTSGQTATASPILSGGFSLE